MGNPCWWRGARWLAILVLGLATASCHNAATVAPGYHEYAYVTNGKSNSVSVLDLLQLRNVRTIAVGMGPTGVAASPTRNEIYVANADSNNISIIDAERNEQVAVIGVHRAPYFVSVSADGKRAYVANAGSSNVSVIDLTKRAVISTIAVGNGPGMA
jgi:YVTN family beta-propeller protein